MLAHALWLCVRMAALATFKNQARLAMALVPAIFRFDTASSPRSPIDVASWQPFTGDECRIALLLIFLSGLTFTNVLRPVPRAAWLAFSARLPPARGLSWIKVHLLDGTVLLRRQRQRCTSAPITTPKLRSSALRRLARGSVAAAARVTAGVTARAPGQAAALAAWRRQKDQRFWNKLSTGTKLFYLLYALLVCGLQPPESVIATVPTPSQLATDPFMSPQAHSKHLLDHQVEQLLSFGPHGFDALLASSLPCNVTLDFTLLDPDAPYLELVSVPSSETVQSMMVATAAMVGISEVNVGLLYDEFHSPNPLTPLSALAVSGRVVLRVFPRDNVGGDRSDTSKTPSHPQHHDTFENPSHPRHPGRRRLDPQLDPVEYPSRRAESNLPAWYCKAMAEKERTGKAKGSWDPVFAEFWGASLEDVIRQRDMWLHKFEHPPRKAAPTGKRFAPTVEREPRAKRGKAPANLAEEKGAFGPSSESARAGPGRGRTFEPAADSKGSCSTLLEEPTAILAATSTNWLAQANQRKQWQTNRIHQLEGQLAAAVCREKLQACTIERQAATIVELRARAQELEAEEWQLAEQLLSHMPTDTPLQQASHAKALLEDPKWNAVLGVGYRDDQKRSLVYQHVSKLLDRTREITGGDPLKAKYLADLM